MILFGVSCIATPFVDAHPEHVRMLRCRADSVLRFWQGDQEYLQGSNEAARSLPGYYAHEFSPRTRREDVSLFVWDCFQDIWAPFFDINGYPTSFYDLKAEDRARLTQFPPLPLEALRALWLKVDALLTEQGIRKGLIFVQPDRLAATSPELAELLARYKDTILAMISTLAPLGWNVFLIPHDAPRHPDGFWSHYEPSWLANFVESAIKHCENTPWTAPK